MKLGELIAGLDVRSRGEETSAADVRICDVTEDSRTIMPGSLFIVRRGATHDGRTHIPDAVRAGAAAVLVEGDEPVDGAGETPILRTPDAAFAMAHIGERFFSNPSQRLTLIGVTGTNGKTTIAHLIHQIFNFARVRCGLIGTVAIDDGVESAPATMTTPSSLELSRLFSVMLEAGCRAAVMEVSSHSLHQKRVAAIDFDAAMFTNLTGDHLDYHKTMENYAAAKAILFESLRDDAAAILNVDDPAASRMARDCRAPITACSLETARVAPLSRDAVARCHAIGEEFTMSHTQARFVGPWGEIAARPGLVGRHNLMNLLQAIAAAHACGIPVDAIRAALPRIAAPPGRLERVVLPGIDSPFSVLVDYAHSDDSLAKVLETLRPLISAGGRLRVVLGCGGDRDRTKRPRMGEVATRLADDVIITSDNPRTEDPQSIIDQMLVGVRPAFLAKVHTDTDRERAIHHAVESARAGDIVLIAGKGHEDYQILPDGRGGTIRRDFDDRLVARRALRLRFGAAATALEPAQESDVPLASSRAPRTAPPLRAGGIQ